MGATQLVACSHFFTKPNNQPVLLRQHWRSTRRNQGIIRLMVLVLALSLLVWSSMHKNFNTILQSWIYQEGRKEDLLIPGSQQG